MSNHGNLYFLFMIKVIMVVHLARYKGICPSCDGVGQQKSPRTATNGHLTDRPAQQLVAHHALHIERFFKQNHEIVGCQRLLKHAHHARCAFNTNAFALLVKGLYTLSRPEKVCMQQSHLLGNLKVHAASCIVNVGLTEAEVSGALLCLDVTERVVDEAITKGCNLIVAHHPLIFRKLSQVTDANYVQRTVIKAIKNDIVIVAMHTNLDAAFGGVNFKIAEKLGLRDVRFFGREKVVTNPLTDKKVTGGDGVIGCFDTPLAADDLILLLKKEFDVECVQANELLWREIRTVALCGGSGSFLLQDAINAGADAFITGEMGYHEFFGHEQEIQLCVIGHYQSEQYTTEVLRDVIERDCPGVKCCISEINTNPIVYFS